MLEGVEIPYIVVQHRCSYFTSLADNGANGLKSFSVSQEKFINFAYENNKKMYLASIIREGSTLYFAGLCIIFMLLNQSDESIAAGSGILSNEDHSCVF